MNLRRAFLQVVSSIKKKAEFNESWNDELEIYIPGRLAIDIYKFTKSLNFTII